MEDILASIRRILAEDEPVPEVPAPVAGAPSGAEPPGVKDDVLVLDASMLAPAEAGMAAPAAGAEAVADAASVVMASGRAAGADMGMRPNSWPCFEDAVREAMEPMIRQWLETALPKLAERMVRAEVERVVGGVL